MKQGAGGAARVVRLALLCASAWLGWAHGVAEDPRTTFGMLVTASALFVFLPLAMCIAVSAMTVVPAVLLTPAALIARASGRRSGLRGLLCEMLAIGWAILPGYVRALRTVRAPLAWGIVWGSLGAVPLLGLSLATRPPLG